MVSKAVRRDHSPPPKRQAVSIVLHPDGHAEAFAERNIDVRFVRVPIAKTRDGEVLAEECARLMLPLRYRELWRADLLRANASTRPLDPRSALDALAARDCIAALEPFTPPKKKKGAA